MNPQSLIFLAVMGLMIGSFLNVCIGRLPAGESVVTPGSRCPSCRAAIRWYDNIPVVSYLALRGRCRKCRASISVRYPIVEATTAVAFVAQGLAVGPDVWLLTQRLVLTALLITMFGTDLETQRLPNVLTLPGILVGFVFSVMVPPGPLGSALGIALGGGVLLAIRSGWKAVTGVDGMGLGDVKMLAMVGAFLGWQQVVVVLLFASISGAVIGILMTMLQGKSLQHRLPFGTFLAIGAFTASLSGDAVVAWYLQFYR